MADLPQRGLQTSSGQDFFRGHPTEAGKRELMQRALKGPLYCGHRDKAGDLCAEPVELTAEGESTHESRLVNLEHDVLAVSAGQLARLRAGKSVNTQQLTNAESRRRDLANPVTEGWYKLGDDIYKVQRAVHGSGNLYAKLLVVEELADEELNEAQRIWKEREPTRMFHSASWQYAQGAIRRLRGEHRLSDEDAKMFGRLYGVCVKCARTLTKEESIERGMGDVCAGKGI
jgi:hypothetical protein